MHSPTVLTGAFLALWAVCSVDGLVAQDTKETPLPQSDTPTAPQPITTFDPAVPREQLRLMVRPLTKSELDVEATAWFELLRAKSRQIAAVRLGLAKTSEALSSTDEKAAQASLEKAETVTESADSAAAATQQRLTEAAAGRLSGVRSPKDTGSGDAPSARPAGTGPNAAGAAGAADGSEVDKQVEEASKDTVDNGVELAVEAAPSSQTINSATSMRREFLVGVIELQEQRTALRDRLYIVLDSLEAKGGEVQEYRQYALAVSGLEIDTSTAGSIWSGLQGWVVSQAGGQRVAWNLFKFAMILLLTYVIGKIIAGLVNWLLERKVKLPKLAESLISRTIKNVVLLIGFVVALTALEVDVTPIAAAIGATGLVVGLALQGTLSNFASGLMILINRPFDVGNVVNAGGVTGTIDEMNLVSTKFRTFDNQTIYVPNNEIWENVIINITANAKRRVDLEFGVGYSDDFEQAEQIIRDVALAHELVDAEPRPDVVMHELADSSVNIVCRSWANTSDWWRVKTDLVREVKRRFDAAGITIPYPQRDVHVHHAPVPSKESAAVQKA